MDKGVKKGMLIPFFINAPCCGRHQIPSNVYTPEQSNTLIVTGFVTEYVWVLVGKVYEKIQKPGLIGVLGRPANNFFDLSSTPYLCPEVDLHWSVCPTNSEVIQSMLQKLSTYALKGRD